ncbi:hypothetical protein [Streptomyces sp. NPDC006285]|uniref:hypothetical protein n=1 Tax=Streptomyces sp. NPDC006285 TaxID=3364742 RepID=UPI0036C52DA9
MHTEFEHTGAAPPIDQLDGVDRFIWRTPFPGAADFRNSQLNSLLVLSIGSPLTLRVPPTLTQLTLTGELTAVAVDGLTAPEALVQLQGDVSGGLPHGITGVARLEVSDTAELDLTPLDGMPALRELTVRNVLGRLSGCSALAATGALERIGIFRCYDIDTAGFPVHADLPRLTWISISDVSAADATILRTRIDGFWNGHVHLARSRRWLESHQNNPFSTWGDDSPALGPRARCEWRRASARLTVASTTDEKEAAIQGLADALDRMAADDPFDTLRREQAGDAIRDLATAQLPVEHPLANWEPT